MGAAASPNSSTAAIAVAGVFSIARTPASTRPIAAPPSTGHGPVRSANPAEQHPAAEAGKLQKSELEYLFEPNAGEVFGNLLPHYLNYQVYQYLLEAKASEHSARMVAMKSATDNAKQLIKDLTLEYNKLRQANITKELLEITSAAMAMG